MNTALAEKIAPASPASWLAKTFIQDTAYAIHGKPCTAEQMSGITQPMQTDRKIQPSS